MKHVAEIIERPLLTEKTTLLRYAGGFYAFRVRPASTKGEIANAIETQFGVKVETVRTANFHGKFKRVRKGAGYRSDWKKAYVKLVKGQTIEALEGV